VAISEIIKKNWVILGYNSWVLLIRKISGEMVYLNSPLWMLLCCVWYIDWHDINGYAFWTLH
jgi:hypothetical protein